MLFLEATCSNCWHKQYATHDPTYTLQFTTISSSNIRKKHSPLQLVKSSNSQTNAVDHILCNQCVRFLSKDIKSKDFADSYPSFLWNLLAGNYNAVYSGQDLWRMIPSTMRPWWIHSLTESGQDWCHAYHRQISLTSPRPLFDDRTSGMTNFLKDVGSGHPGSFVKALKNEKEFLPNVMCPFGCSEYCFKGNHVAWDLVIQRLLLKVLLPHIDKTRYLHVQHMWDQYDREDDDFDSIFLNPGWEIRPAIVISESGCPWVVTCRNHGGGSKFQVLYLPCYPDHHLSAKCTDQLCPIVV